MTTNKWSNYKERKYLTDEQLDNHKSFYSKLFEKYNIDTKNQTAIEIEAGHGIHTKVFVDFFKKYSAVEPNEELFEQLKTLDSKYKDIRFIKSTCEDLPIEGQVSFVIFTHIFQFTNFEKCKETIDKILKENGYLLMSLPFVPFRFGDDFEKNSKWRTEIIDTITFLINMEGYQLKYLDRALGSYILLFQKN